MPERFKPKSKSLFNSFYEDFPKNGTLALSFILNVAIWIVLYGITYFCGLALGVDLSFSYYLAILPIATIIAQIPVTINGLGLREGTMIGLFGLFGVEAVVVFSMSILTLVITGIIPAIIAIFIILGEMKK